MNRPPKHPLAAVSSAPAIGAAVMLCSDLSRIRTLAEARMVLDHCKSTKSELAWALRAALDLAEAAEARLLEGEPIISAVEEIAKRVAMNTIGDAE